MNYWTGKSHSLERDSKQSNYSIHINIFILINIQKLPVTESFFFFLPIPVSPHAINYCFLEAWNNSGTEQLFHVLPYNPPLIQLQSVPSPLFVPPEGWDKTILLVLPMTSDGIHLKNCYKKLQEINLFFFPGIFQFFSSFSFLFMDVTI